MRKLLVTRRTVPLDRSDEYAEAWRLVVQAAAALPGRAWLFRRAGHDDQYVEFIEWQDEAAAGDAEVLLAVRRELDGLGFGHTDELEEATP